MKKKDLTQEYSIYQLLSARKSQTYIAKIIGVNRTTISRELKRNKGKKTYSPLQAQNLAKERFKRVRTLTLDIEKFAMYKIVKEQFVSRTDSGLLKEAWY